MKVTIKILTGPKHQDPLKCDIDKNISALERATKKASIIDSMLLESTISILKGIRQELKK